jgi:hypothetical protein
MIYHKLRFRQWQIVGVTNLFRGAMDITRHAGQAPLWRNLASRLLNQTAILVGRVVSEALAVEGTHRYQLAALATLDAFGAVSQAELCRRTNIDRSDMNAVVKSPNLFFDQMVCSNAYGSFSLVGPVDHT